MTTFRQLLNKFSSGFSESELSQLKFMCQDKIGKRKLEGVTSGIGLFTILIEQGEMSAEQTGFLKQLLRIIKRQDLEEELDSYIENGTNVDGEQLDRNQQEQLSSAFEVICDNVGRDWRMLIRALGVSETKIENIIDDNPRHMREQLRKCLIAWQRIKGQDAHVDLIVQALRKCKMVSVADKLEERLRSL